MNKLGMAVDVSHCGDRPRSKPSTISKKPGPDHPLQLPRAESQSSALQNRRSHQSLAAKGGVMGITEVRMFITTKEPTTIESMSSIISIM